VTDDMSEQTVSFTEDGNRNQAGVAARTLIFDGPARFQCELHYDGAIKLNPDCTLSAAGWLRDENGEWGPLAAWFVDPHGNSLGLLQFKDAATD
jgi:hypothetical protein